MFVIPFFWIGIVSLVYSGKGRTLLLMLGTAIAFLSLSPHKEYRFLLPLLPAAIPIAAYGLSQLRWRRFLFWLVIVLNVPAIIYLSLWHQVAPLATMDFLRTQPVTSALFLVNCHGTPFYSHLHNPIPLYFLHCEPTSSINYSREFFEEPTKHLETFLEEAHPSHIIIWSSLYTPQVKEHLKDFKVIEEFFHAHLTESPLGYESNVSFLVLAKA
mmetsp:Transcript_19007/g.34530  ORF Transcript_19007/g.34530 Transcript_19007/m.34530 type:complete len:214 (-) Transcript_19007:2928-3569(-)